MLGRSRGVRMNFGQRQGLRPNLSPGGSLVPSSLFSTPQEPSTPSVRRLPSSPAYAGGGPFSSVLKPQGPKLLRDCLYDRMVDGEFHEVSELDEWLPGNRWVEAMIALIVWGFAFDKQDKAFRLRKRRLGERRQFVVPLLSGVTLPRYLNEGEQTDVKTAEEEISFTDPTEQVETEIPQDERMVLDAEGAVVVSAPDMVTETIGILARKGAGKTYLANVIAEEFLGSSFAIPFVALDPTGVWRGLGADVDGHPNANRLLVFGGKNGHYPLRGDEGRLLAKIVVGMRPMPAIMDMSELDTEDQHGFVADFVGELYLLNKEPLHLFIDEADSFAPQRLDKTSRHQKRSLSVVDNLVRRGRTRGLGVTLITQRAAVINKNVLSQVGAMFFLRMGSPQDLDAVEQWMVDGQVRPDARRECRKNLSGLGQGQAYYMRGGDKYTFSRFMVRSKTTFDSSVTPRIGEEPRMMTVMSLSDDDLREIEVYFQGPGFVVPETMKGDLSPEGELEASVLGQPDDDEAPDV